MFSSEAKGGPPVLTITGQAFSTLGQGLVRPPVCPEFALKQPKTVSATNSTHSITCCLSYCYPLWKVVFNVCHLPHVMCRIKVHFRGVFINLRIRFIDHVISGRGILFSIISICSIAIASQSVIRCAKVSVLLLHSLHIGETSIFSFDWKYEQLLWPIIP